jgi:uncharacterized protein YndB with AHSA1/START domain
MKNPVPLALVLVCLGSSLPAEIRTAGKVSINKVAAQEKALEFEVVVPASVHDVWLAMSTSDGLKTWLTPKAVVDLRPGGDWLAMFPGAAPGGGTIVDFTPEQRLALRAMAPEKFPTVRAETTLAVFTFEGIDDHSTRVRLRQTGWKSGPEWDQAYDYLADGNAQLLNALWYRFAKGPIDWEKALARTTPKAQ